MSGRRHAFSSILGSGRFPWKRAWQPIPVFLPGKFQGQRSLAAYSPCGLKDLDTNELLSTHACVPIIHDNWIVLTFCISFNMELWQSMRRLAAMTRTVNNLLQCRIPGFNPWVGKISWRSEWQLTPVLLPGVSHGQRILARSKEWHHWATNTFTVQGLKWNVRYWRKLRNKALWGENGTIFISRS